MLKTFMHYRKHDRMGQVVPKGGLTLGIEQDGNVVKISMAECGRKDNFNKAMGRMIAEGRLEAGKVTIIQIPEATNLKSFVHQQKFIKEKTDKLLAGGGR